MQWEKQVLIGLPSFLVNWVIDYAPNLVAPLHDYSPEVDFSNTESDTVEPVTYLPLIIILD